MNLGVDHKRWAVLFVLLNFWGPTQPHLSVCPVDAWWFSFL